MLIVVIWACLGLVALVLVFGQAMAMNYRGAGNDLAARQADAAIEGAVHYAEYILSNVNPPGLFPDPTTYVYEAVPVGDATFWFLGGDSQNALNSRPFGLADEASKLNANTASATLLQLLPGMTSDFASAIVAWRTPAGADSTLSGSVSGLDGNTYTPKYAPFETPEEIGMVNGADKTFLYGEDANLNGALDPNEDDGDKTLPSDNSDGKLDPGLLSYLTTFTREPNKRADGSARINISDLRPGRPGFAALRTLFEKTPTLSTQFSTVISRFSGDGQVISVLDFYLRSQLTPDQYAPIADALTVTDAPYLYGLVNVNTASQEVLAAIPSLTADGATALVAARQTRTTRDTSIAWAGEALRAIRTADAAGRFLTGASYQACVDVAAVGKDGRGYRRTRFVIDTSTGTPRIIYRRDLTGLGWALGSDIRQQLADNKGRLAPR